MGEKRVDLLGPIRLLHEHLTAALCESVFRARRISERRRIWTLHLLVEFWTAVILRAPESLRQALDEAHRGTGGYPSVQATPEGFFARAKGLRWEFFRDIFDAFVERLVAQRGGFEKELRKELAAFPEVWVVDGSGLDAIAHRLKVLWDERAVVLPGSLLVFYDLFRGLPRRVLFYAEAFGNEVVRLEGALDALPKGVLLVGDRAYASVRLFAGLSARGLFAVTRQAKHLRVERLERLRRETSGDGAVLEDLLVLVGSGFGAEPQKLRLIRRRKGKKVLALLTNVLDPKLLSAEAALRLYRRRWSVERMFYDLKEVLNLRRFYAANVNAVAMQVYASALVYVAMRTAQSRVAKSLRVDPERLSTEKLFPKVAVASHDFAVGEIVFAGTQHANPEFTLREPDWDAMPFSWADAGVVIVQPRHGKRRQRRFCAARGNHASLHTFTRRTRR
jgi:hypothetical protein